jgi:hypothetical protein
MFLEGEMNAIWQWFLAHGDKLLSGVTGALGALVVAGLIPPGSATVAVITGIASVLHTVFLPEPSPTPAAPPK